MSQEIRLSYFKKNIKYFVSVNSSLSRFEKQFQEQQQQLGLKFEALESDEEPDKESVSLKQSLQAEGEDQYVFACVKLNCAADIILE